MIRPVCSAIGMNSAGSSRPSRGWSQRSSASKPAMVRSSSRTIGWKNTLISPRSSARRISASSVRRSERCARMAGAEHLDAVAARALGVAHGDFGVLQHVVGVGMQSADRTARCRSRRTGDLAIGEPDRRRQRRGAPKSASAMTWSALVSETRMIAKASPPRRASVSCGCSSRVRRCAMVSRMLSPIGDADLLVDLLEAVDVDARGSSGARPSPCARKSAPPPAGRRTIRDSAGR